MAVSSEGLLGHTGSGPGGQERSEPQGQQSTLVAISSKPITVPVAFCLLICHLYKQTDLQLKISALYYESVLSEIRKARQIFVKICHAEFKGVSNKYLGANSG